jgi:hypothetical protein
VRASHFKTLGFRQARRLKYATSIDPYPKPHPAADPAPSRPLAPSPRFIIRVMWYRAIAVLGLLILGTSCAQITAPAPEVGLC